MSFIESMEKVLNEDFNKSVTENGAVGYRTTGTALLDFNFKVSSYRGKSEDEITKDFMKVFYEDKVTAMKFLFFIRDREEGLGERRIFRVIIKHLATTETDIVKAVIPVVAEYGRWDDLLELFDTPLETEVISLFDKQIGEDTDNYNAGKPISLLAKWLPSINATSEKTIARAKKIIKHAGVTEKHYRKMLSVLRKYIDVTERKMCANEWDKIVYEGVPSRANLNYNGAFLRHDEERRREFLGQVEKGEKKINAGKLYPHDIVHKYTNGSSYLPYTGKDNTLEALWKALPKKEIANTLVVADGSGSMASRIGKTDISALDVANALAIYFAEHNKGEFHNQYITFSENPQLVKFNDEDSLHDKIAQCLAHDEVANTNIEKVFGLILRTAINNNLSQEEMPKNILIISDMEFDSCADCGTGRGYYRERPNKTLFQVIEKAYKDHGYKLPKLVFWNVNSRTGTIPMKENDLGVALVSGFSTNIAEMVMNDKLDPLEILLDKLNTKRYEKIGKIIKKVL